MSIFSARLFWHAIFIQVEVRQVMLPEVLALNGDSQSEPLLVIYIIDHIPRHKASHTRLYCRYRGNYLTLVFGVQIYREVGLVVKSKDLAR